jgi:tight adherence protein B
MTTLAAFTGPAVLVLVAGGLWLGPPGARGAARRPDSASSDAAHGSAPGWLVEGLTAAGLTANPDSAWAVARWAGPAGLAAVALTVGPMVAVAGAGLVLAVPRSVGPALRRRRRHQVDTQLPAALERLASALRAGAAPAPAFIEVADAAPEPLASDLRAPASEVRHGAPLATAVDRWAARRDASPAVRLTGAALGLGIEAGGEVARSIDRVAATLRERREVQAEVHALATQARASSGVLACAPLGFTALIASIEPTTVRFLLTTPIGLLCLVAGLVLEVAGTAWMARITRLVT